MTFGKKVVSFNKSLSKGLKVPDSFKILDPFSSPKVRSLSEQFYNKFYDDLKSRIFILGINPGRFGAGVTGIPFTDPVHLEKYCGISNDLHKRHELSSVFVFDFINAFGGCRKFYSKFFITAVCPLGFTRDGKNINYYDNRILQDAVEEFIVQKMKTQLDFGSCRDTAIIMGEGKNFKYFSALNQKHHFFKELIPLAHPRYILQYKRKQMKRYLNDYLSAFSKSISLANH
jgi:hypothetical protein